MKPGLRLSLLAAVLAVLLIDAGIALAIVMLTHGHNRIVAIAWTLVGHGLLLVVAAPFFSMLDDIR